MRLGWSLALPTSDTRSVALLVLLAAAAGTRIVAADFRLAIVNRLHGGRLGAVASLSFRHFAVAAGHGGRFGVVDGRDLPKRPNEGRAFLFDAENGRRHLLIDAVPHCDEGFASLALVLDLGVELSVPDQADPRAEMVHEIEMVFPRGVENFEDQRPLRLGQLGPI